MTTFGKRQGGGRRVAARKSAPLLVVFTSVTQSHRAELIDLSSTGARLSSDWPPDEGEELFLAREGWRTFGRVVWCKEREFAMRFDAPITQAEVDQFTLLSGKIYGLDPEMNNAVDVWMGGSAR